MLMQGIVDAGRQQKKPCSYGRGADNADLARHLTGDQSFRQIRLDAPALENLVPIDHAGQLPDGIGKGPGALHPIQCRLEIGRNGRGRGLGGRLPRRRAVDCLQFLDKSGKKGFRLPMGAEFRREAVSKADGYVLHPCLPILEEAGFYWSRFERACKLKE